MAKRILLVLVILALTLVVAGWKWGPNSHREAGWTWDDYANPTWVED